MRAALIAAVVAASVLVLGTGRGLAQPSVAHATPADDLQRARDAFRTGDYASAMPLLNYLLYPTPRLSRTGDLVEAHVLLGVAAFESGDRKVATREFEEALFLAADLTLDTLMFSRAAVEYFDETKAAVAERARRDAEQRRIAQENDRLKALLASMIVIERRPYYVNFIPFGAGQFQNRQAQKGIAFAVGQGVTGAASAGIWLYLVGEYGFGGTVPENKATGVRRLQQIEIGAGVACLGLVAWGVIDSLIYYQPTVQQKADESLIPDDLRTPQPPSSPRARRKDDGARSWLVAPMPLPGGAGVALTWEY